MDCSVVEARAWMHRGHLSCLVFLRDEEADTERMACIEACLGHLLSGGDSTSAGSLGGAVAAVPVPPSRTPSVASTSSCLLTATRRSIWAKRGYSVVTVQCHDRPKLLFDVVCTLTDMDYVVFHGTIDTTDDQAHQEFYIRHADGSPIRSEAERQRVSQCLQDAQAALTAGLLPRRATPLPPAWGLAKVASLVSINNADLATDDIKALEAGPSQVAIKPAPAESPPAKAATEDDDCVSSSSPSGPDGQRHLPGW
ncbi:hypothetical protein E2562_011974 [Oryza meyeriana var. granulata]|uniref:ACT domain-containing protein ACR n=1 Tax=Oryza meyeriana var. granulata TaxID=110450 RepID=A0A6G1F6Y1_9ORYZ|nr:hypothetical protein E2562_011974 [Oryza meyeriana var. granulata]